MCLIIVLINKEYDDMKEGITNLRLNQFIEDVRLFIKYYYHIVWSVEK